MAAKFGKNIAHLKKILSFIECERFFVEYDQFFILYLTVSALNKNFFL